MPNKRCVPFLLTAFDNVRRNYEILMCHVTGNQMSKYNYDLQTVLAVSDDYINKCIDEAIDEEVVRCANCQHYECVEGGIDFCSKLEIGVTPNNYCGYGWRIDNK
jgi:hypothetical protein